MTSSNVIKPQSYVGSVLKKLFPNNNVLSNTRKVAQLEGTQGNYLELDFYIPELNIAFEAQDPRHYTLANYSNETLDSIKNNDDSKRNQFGQSGGTLIIVPYWWDGSAESLVATIHQQRPEILLDFNKNKINVTPISLFPPTSTPTQEAQHIPGVGPLMHSSFAHTVGFTQYKWWLSEKYDGIRGVWNSNHLYSKYGRIIHIPSQFTFPLTMMDGEFWFGRATTELAQQIFTVQEQIYWSNLRYLSLDHPFTHPDFNIEKRFSILLNAISYDHSFIRLLCHVRCEEEEQLKKFLQCILQDSGEGVIMHKPRSLYIRERTDECLKYKAKKDDEALVLRVNGDGTYDIQLTNGTIVQATMQNRINKRQLNTIPKKESVKIGSVVTYSYNRFDSEAKPVQVVITRLRPEAVWRDLVSLSPRSFSVNESTKRKMGEVANRLPRGFWTVGESENIRKFFLDFAKKKNFDPFNKDAWYAITHHDVKAVKGGRVLLDHYGGSLPQTLIANFPDLGFDVMKFSKLGNFYWKSMDNRRKFVDMLAAKLQIDPLLPEAWYKYRGGELAKLIKKERGGISLLAHYSSSAIKLLMDVYPTINLDSTKFFQNYKGYWSEKRNVRRFFDDIAHNLKFDPLLPENWYNLSAHHIISRKGGAVILSAYGRLRSVIMATYPEVDFDSSLFVTPRKQITWSTEKQREFFLKFAKENNFDFRQRDEWFARRSMLTRDPEGLAILNQYNWSLGKALLGSFPNVEFTNMSLFFSKREQGKQRRVESLMYKLKPRRGKTKKNN